MEMPTLPPSTTVPTSIVRFSPKKNASRWPLGAGPARDRSSIDIPKAGLADRMTHGSGTSAQGCRGFRLLSNVGECKTLTGFLAPGRLQHGCDFEFSLFRTREEWQQDNRRMEETAQSMEQDDLDEGGREPSIEVTDVYIYCVRIQASRQDIGSRTHYDKRKSSWEDIAVLLYTLIPSLRQLSSTKTFP